MPWLRSPVRAYGAAAWRNDQCMSASWAPASSAWPLPMRCSARAAASRSLERGPGPAAGASGNGAQLSYSYVQPLADPASGRCCRSCCWKRTRRGPAPARRPRPMGLGTALSGRLQCTRLHGRHASAAEAGRRKPAGFRASASAGVPELRIAHAGQAGAVPHAAGPGCRGPAGGPAIAPWRRQPAGGGCASCTVRLEPALAGYSGRMA